MGRGGCLACGRGGWEGVGRVLTCVWCGWAGVLLVAGNKIGDAGATSISEALAVNTVLTRLCFYREYVWARCMGAGLRSLRINFVR